MASRLKNFRNIALACGVFLVGCVLSGCKNEHIFHDGTTSPTPFEAAFLVLGDNRSGDRVYADIVAAITSSLSFAKCLINTGDMITNAGNRKQWENFLKMTAPLAAKMSWYGVVGNHEVNSLASQQIYQEVLNFPGNELYYSFDTLNSHFIILDTEIPGQIAAIIGEQLAWLKHDLQTRPPAAQYTFVFTHRPLFPQRSKRGSNLLNADELHQLFRQYKVDIVFSGHEHEYYTFPKDTLHYVITGGAGAPVGKSPAGQGFHHFLLVELLAPGEILIQVLDVHGKIIQTEVLNNETHP